MSLERHREKIGFIWSVADLLRGDYKQSEYGLVILPFTVLRRLDCVLAPTKQAVMDQAKALPAQIDDKMRDQVLKTAAKHQFYNTSPYSFDRLKGDPDNLAANLDNYVGGFPADVQSVFIEHYRFAEQLTRLDQANLLFLIVDKFASIDLGPTVVENHEMGLIFEELIRKFSEQSNETAGEHFTPREVIRLMVNLLFTHDRDALTKKSVITTLYDPACGTGGMLSVAEDYLLELNPDATIKVFGQELNPASYAICKSDMLIKGQDAQNIKFGNSFSNDGLPDQRFDYMLSNPPFGVEWKKVEKEIREEHERRGMAGRFGVGLPRINDGSLLFVQHMVSKMQDSAKGSRIAVVLNGSPLFTGGAGSGESEIRRWLIENDWVEAIVALPPDMFYNTGISTYIWLITNQKPTDRRGRIQLINAADLFEKMRKSLGSKRKQLGESDIAEITRLYGDFAETDRSKLFDNAAFGYWRVTVERPLKLNFEISENRIAAVMAARSVQNLTNTKKKGAAGDAEIAEGRERQAAIEEVLANAIDPKLWKAREPFAKHLKGLFKSAGETLPPPLFKAVLMGLSERDETAETCMIKGQPEPDPELRDFENIPLTEDIEAYFEREVLPHVPDAWMDEASIRKGYEIPFNRHFYTYTPPRPLAEIDADLKALGGEIQVMLKEVMG